MKPIIAEYDRDIELLRADKDIASKALDYASQAFNDAGQGVDAVINAWSKLLDSIKAFSITKG
jgi:hypothetical protein